jgi:hypothetical protein
MESRLRQLALLVASGRVAIGLGALAAPTLMARPWVGPPAGTPAARLLARTMGGRDLALGVGALRALADSDRDARRWVALGGTADAVDALATLIAFAHLPRVSRWGILALTTGAAVVSLQVARSLDEDRTDPDPDPVPGEAPAA